jgi:hypothetical protein
MSKSALPLTSKHQERNLRPRKPPLKAQANPSRPSGRANSKRIIKSIEKKNTATSKLTSKRTQKSPEKRREQAQSRLTVEDLYPEIDQVNEPPCIYVSRCMLC